MKCLRATDLSLQLGARQVLRQLSVSLGEGERVGLIGPNGAGKSSLLRALAGLLRPAAGEVTLDQQTLARWPRRDLAKTIAYLPQNGPSHWAMTVEAVVALGRLPHHGPFGGASGADRQAVQRALAAMDLEPFAQRPVSELSGGERARVLLARCLAGEPRYLLADEPAAGLDPAHQLDLMRELTRLSDANVGVLVVLHDLTLAARFCQRLVLLAGGEVLADGPPPFVLTVENIARAYGVEAELAELDGSLVVLPRRRL